MIDLIFICKVIDGAALCAIAVFAIWYVWIRKGETK